MEYLLLSQSQKYPLPQQTSLPPPPTASSSSRNIISPALLFIIVILAAIFFVSGLLHLLIRFLIKKTASRSRGRGGTQDFSGSDALQRQLQQLFYLHDSGLDQASIDALPVFPYGEIVGVGGGGGGSEDPFDCAVCLCEFLREDRLRLLPRCGHAFHLCCIDTWLLSNSTCPLCRGALLVHGVAAENPVSDSEEEESRLEEEGSLGREVEVPVRLGKFRRSTGNGNEEGNSIDESSSSSSSNLDTRRCYSMGSYQYIVRDANLRVALCAWDRSGRRGRGKESSRNLDVTVGLEKVEEEEGKRLGAARKGESFSVSKIWLWGNKKGKLPGSSVSGGDSL